MADKYTELIEQLKSGTEFRVKGQTATYLIDDIFEIGQYTIWQRVAKGECRPIGKVRWFSGAVMGWHSIQILDKTFLSTIRLSELELI